jgi:ABC-2 type transport system ATP-binding protein
VTLPASLGPPAVEARRLVRRFGEVTAVDGLDLSVQPGEIFGLVGPDGAGKTTTLRVLAGVLPPSSGTAVVVGIDVAREPSRLRHRVGYVAQRFALYGDLTVAENVRFFADAYGVGPSDRAARAAELLAMADLDRFRGRLADHLSGGMKQKLALVCGLIHRPDVLFLDEPTAGVDPVSRRDLWRMLYRLQEGGLTVVLSTAYMDEAERCHRLALLSDGRVVAVGTPDDLRRRLPGAIVEVVLGETTPTSLRLARDAARRLPGVRGAQLFGDRLHVALARPDLIGDLAAALGSTVPVASARPVEPTIEDVFLGLRDRSALLEAERTAAASPLPLGEGKGEGVPGGGGRPGPPLQDALTRRVPGARWAGWGTLSGCRVPACGWGGERDQGDGIRGAGSGGAP